MTGSLCTVTRVENYLLIAAVNFICILLARSTKNDKYEKTLKGLKDEILLSFGLPKVIVSDNEKCYI